MPYISEYTIVEDGDVYRIRLTDNDITYDSEIIENIQVALERLEELKNRDGLHG